jgi:uncharacterized protein (DUF58 family)
MFKPDATQLIVGLFVLALLLGQEGFALLLGLVLLALAVARGWSRVVLRGVHYERRFRQDRAFVGDEVVVDLHIRNPKLLGVPGLRIRDSLSARLFVVDTRVLPHTQGGVRQTERWTTLRAYEAVNWHMTVRCEERGYFAFGPVSLLATDPWGLYTVEATLSARDALVVYPKLVPLASLGFHPRHPLGDLRASQRLLTDPARTVGIRDYQQGDPFKAIHWGATARRNEMQTRIYEPTTSQEIAIALDLDTFEHYWEGQQPELAEWMISAAASIATAVSDARWSLGLYANCATADQEQFVRLAPNRSPAQLGLVMETLAKLVPYSIAPMPNILRRLGPTLPWGATLLVISSVPSEAMQHALLRLAERGRHILWLFCGPQAPPPVPGVDVRHIVPDEPWMERATRTPPRAASGKVMLHV